MNTDNTAQASITVAATKEEVWKALTDPQLIRKYMMGAEVTSDWKQGSSIVWKGEMAGKPFEDRGRVIEVQEPDLLRYSHKSGTAGNADEHEVTWELEEEGDSTRVELSQTNNATEKARAESEKNWTAMLEGMKKVVEGK